MQRTHTCVVAVILAAFALGTVGLAGASPKSASVRQTTLDTSLLAQINVVRQTRLLPPLTRSTALSVVANRHTTEMIQTGYFSHSSRDHTLFWKRIEESYSSSGYRSWSVGEILLSVVPNVGALQAIDLLMHSPAHRANLLDPAWREVGIAARHSDNAPGAFAGQPVTIVTADFGARHKAG